MKLFIFLIACFFSVNNIFSQSNNYKITYRHCVQFDTTKISHDTIGIEAILIGNSKESNYCFLRNRIQTISKEKSFEDIIKSKQDGKIAMKIGIDADSIGNMVYFNKEKNGILLREKMENEYIINVENKPNIVWTILEDKKLIKNYQCQKATTYFRGRNYTAWFTTELGIIAAPWKFNGLPGLIMSIEDFMQVNIFVERIEFPTKEKVPIFINSGRKITQREYVNFRETEHKKRTKAMQLILDNQPNMDVMIKAGYPRPTITSTYINYGIEKP